MGTKGKADEALSQLSTRVSRTMHKALMYLALDRETTVQALVQEAIEALLSKSPRRPKAA